MPPKAKRRRGTHVSPSSAPQRETRSSQQLAAGPSGSAAAGNQGAPQPGTSGGGQVPPLLIVNRRRHLSRDSMMSRSDSDSEQGSPRSQRSVSPDQRSRSRSRSVSEPRQRTPSRSPSPPPRSPQQAASYLNDTNSEPFTVPFDEGDVTFSVEGRHIYANKAVMSMWSPVMKAMLDGAFRESSQKVIELPGKKYDEMLEFIQVLHPPIKSVRGRYIESLLALAREYLVKPLTDRCEEYLLMEEASVHNLLLADEFDMRALKKKCMDFAKRRASFKELRRMDDGDFDRISLDVQNNILWSKTSTYERILGTCRAIADGRRPGSSSCRHFSGNVGSSPGCKDCTLHMIRNIQYELDSIDYSLDSDE